MSSFPRFEDRNFTRYYLADVEGKHGHDQYVHRCINFAMIVGIAPNHPMFSEQPEGGTKISKGRYTRVGARKPLCKITCEDGRQFTFCCGGSGYVAEFNERIISDPMLIMQKPMTEGFLAIIMPWRGSEESSVSDLLTQDAYNELRSRN